jgi:hypothetical protein
LADKPAIEFAHVDAPNPASTYATACSVFDDLRANLSMLGAGHTGYIEQLRLPKAVELGRKYHAQLLGFVALIQEQHRELGLAGIEL